MGKCLSLKSVASNMRSRSSWSWSRPTPHIYSYNRELKRQTEASSATSVEEVRSTRAQSVVSGGEQTMAARSVRAVSAAPPGQSFPGYTGYYGRQLAMMNEAKKAAESSASVSASAASASMAASKTTAKKTSIAATKTTEVTEKTTTSVSKATEKKAAVKINTAAEMQKSLEYGRTSASKALRRAEIHAASSEKDPRHVMLPRIFMGDDICKVVADLHITPYERKEISGAKAATQQGKLKVERMEKELSKVTESAMAYKSIYAKSASQMAKEALEACESEAASSKKTRKTVIESSSKKSVAAA